MQRLGLGGRWGGTLGPSEPYAKEARMGGRARQRAVRRAGRRTGTVSRHTVHPAPDASTEPKPV